MDFVVCANPQRPYLEGSISRTLLTQNNSLSKLCRNDTINRVHNASEESPEVRDAPLSAQC